MTFSVTNTFTNGTVANATEVNADFTDVENEFNGVTTNASAGYIFLGRGTFNVLATTTAANINYADIDISAGQLGNNTIIKAFLYSKNNGNKGGYFGIGILNTTSTNNMLMSVQTSDGVTETATSEITFIQSSSATDTIIGQSTSNRDSSGDLIQSTFFDTNDATVFTTAFTLRVNAYHNSASTGTTLIEYYIYAIKGGS